MDKQTIQDDNATKKVFNNIEYQKEYYKKNKDNILTKLKEKTKCDICGGSYSYVSKNRHNNTNKHMLAEISYDSIGGLFKFKKYNIYINVS
jgi:hypothetical protein